MIRPQTKPAVHTKFCRGLVVLFLAGIIFMTGCGTTTIFYPNERAAKAADSVIDDIFGQGAVPAPTTAARPVSPKAAAVKQ